MAKVEKEGGVKVNWTPWEGRPAGVDFLESTPEQAKERLVKHQALASNYGMTLIFPQKKCRTRLTHQATLFSRDCGLMEPFRDAVYHARYHEDRDIADPGVLVELGEKAGLEGKALAGILERETYAGELDELRKKGEGLGVEGVPTYVFDGRTIHGVDSTDAVLEAIGK
jgi:predicted DsbA family dithiol-disulfide isomerase